MAITLDELKDWMDEKFNAIDTKLDILEEKIVAEKDIFDICTTCAGLGYTVGFEDSNPGMPIQTTCPLCNGEKRIKAGTIIEQ